MPAPILLSTVGSSGDLFPILAVARALEAAGQPARLALSPEEAARARDEGLDAFAMGPSEDEMLERLGLDRDGLARQIFANPSPILRGAIYPMLADLARELAPEAGRARLVAGTLLAMAAPLAAEMTSAPFVEIALQPMLLRSALDPPRIRGFSPPMRAAPRTAAGRRWNTAWLAVIDAEFRRRHGRNQARVRRDLGLPPTRAVPLFGHPVPPVARLGLWDPAFSPCPPDRAARLTGFPRPRAEPMPDGLLRFLENGAPPLVVTLGSVSHRLGGSAFWHEAAALARRHGLRAVLLAGEAKAPAGPDLCTVPFAAHDLLFPLAAAILHHGGIGTTGAACRAGVPHLVLPLGADQPDNAARIERCGIGRRISRPARADEALAALLAQDVRAKARSIATRLIPDSADRAAAALIEVADRAG